MARMNRFAWYAAALHGASIKRPGRLCPGRCPLNRALRVELLEDRRLLAVVTVDTLGDTVNLNDGVTSLREAVFATNLVGGADTIEFAAALTSGGPATITLTEGELAITDALVINGPGANLLTIDASGNDPTPNSTLQDGDFSNDGDGSRVFNVKVGTSTTHTVSLSGLALTGGDVTGDGGAIFSQVNLNVTDSTISGNSAVKHTHGGDANDGSGGGIHIRYANLTLTRSTISGNSAGYGGGISGGGSMTISGSTISGNSARVSDFSNDGSGGGIWHRFGTLIVTNSTLSGNSAGDRGGAIRIFGGQLMVTNSMIIGNSAASYLGGGGGISGEFMTVTDSTISGNSTGGVGGGVLGDMRLINSTVSGNSAGSHGGGIAGDLRLLSNSTISGNSAGGDGGGVWVSTLAALGASVINSTIVGNSAGGAGGGIRTPYPVELSNSIVAKNARLTGEANDVTGPVTLAFSLLGVNTGATITNNGGNLIGADPLLGPLADNGGPTRTHALLAGSPAFNAGGNPAFLPPPDFDQRGAPYRRVSGGRIDMGAHERQDLTVDILDVGSPRIVPLAEVTIQFSRVVTGLDLGDLNLSLNGGANLLTSGQTLATSDNRTFVLGGLQAISAASGYYSLTLLVSGSGIVGSGSGPLDAGDKTSWAMGRSVLGIKVNTLADERDGSLDDGDISLRDALAAAAPGETVDFDASLNGGTILLTLGELSVTRPVTIDAAVLPAGIKIDASGNDPTPNANDGNGSRVLTIDDGNCLADSLVTIHGVALTGGDTSGGGGAIHTRDPLMLTGITISGNSATFLGGGIRAFSSVTVTSSRIAGNSALSGGGIFASGLLAVTSSTVSDNSAASNNLGGGGGIRVFGSVTVTASTISDNSARDGRGGGVLANGSVTLSSSTISGNLAHFGGGIYTYSSGSLPGNVTARDSTISGNSAQAFGGMLASGLLAVTSSTVSGNSAGGSVGGILAVGAATITSSTISGNSAGSEGGGIWKIGYGALTLAHSTVSGNSAGTEGGGILIGSFSTLQIDHSIVARNTRGASVPNDATGAVTITSSLLGVNTDAIITDNGGNLIGSAAAPLVPLLGPLADNGGPTLTHALLPGSPAINAGDPNFQPGLQGTTEFDQRGAPFTRLAGPRIDVGAFEVQSPNGALTADFDLSGYNDGFDFLSWQRNFGKPSAATFRQGDATADGDVDSSDFAVWSARFGADDTAPQLIGGTQPSTATLVGPAPMPTRSAPSPRTYWRRDAPTIAQLAVSRRVDCVPTQQSTLHDTAVVDAAMDFDAGDDAREFTGLDDSLADWFDG